MKVFKIFSVFMLFLLLTIRLKAQNTGVLPIQVNKLCVRILFLKTGETTASSNICAITAEKGLMMIDTGSLKSIASESRRIIEKDFNRNDFKYVINTSSGLGKTSGNQVYPKAIPSHQTLLCF